MVFLSRVSLIPQSIAVGFRSPPPASANAENVRPRRTRYRFYLASRSSRRKRFTGRKTSLYRRVRTPDSRSRRRLRPPKKKKIAFARTGVSAAAALNKKYNRYDTVYRNSVPRLRTLHAARTTFSCRVHNKYSAARRDRSTRKTSLAPAAADLPPRRAYDYDNNISSCVHY